MTSAAPFSVSLRAPNWMLLLPATGLSVGFVVALYAAGVIRPAVSGQSGTIAVTAQWQLWILAAVIVTASAWLLMILRAVTTITPDYVESRTWWSARRIRWDTADRIIYFPGWIAAYDGANALIVRGIYADVLRSVLENADTDRAWEGGRFAYLRRVVARSVGHSRSHRLFDAIMLLVVGLVILKRAELPWFAVGACIASYVVAQILTTVCDSRRRRRVFEEVASHKFESCIECRYPLRGLGLAGACPECSAPFDLAEISKFWKIFFAREIELQQRYHEQARHRIVPSWRASIVSIRRAGADGTVDVTEEPGTSTTG